MLLGFLNTSYTSDRSGYRTFIFLTLSDLLSGVEVRYSNLCKTSNRSEVSIFETVDALEQSGHGKNS